MTVGVLRLTLFLAHSRSLKEKRRAVRRIKDRVRERFDVALAEVEAHDQWQRAVLAAALVNADSALIQSLLDKIERYVESLDAGQILDRKRDLIHLK